MSNTVVLILWASRRWLWSFLWRFLIFFAFSILGFRIQLDGDLVGDISVGEGFCILQATYTRYPTVLYSLSKR